MGKIITDPKQIHGDLTRTEIEDSLKATAVIVDDNDASLGQKLDAIIALLKLGKL